MGNKTYPFKNEFNLWEWKTQGWHKRKDGGNYRRRGDIINHTAKKIIADNDTSGWAKYAISECIYWLEVRKRWPDGMGYPEIECKNRVSSWYYKQKWQFLKWAYTDKKIDVITGKVVEVIDKDKLYSHTFKPRWQKDQTRDPYIAVIAACVHLGELDWIKEISIPYYCWRQPTWSWHKYLKDPTQKRLKRYRWWEDKMSPPDGFATRLQQLRIDTVNEFNK